MNIRFVVAIGLPLLSFVLLLTLGCGEGEETVTAPVEEVQTEKPPPINYFPMTVGSRWVYRNLDGSEWAIEVSETEELGFHLYHVFNYNPPLEDASFEFLKTPRYARTPNRLLLLVGDEIDDAIEQDIEIKSFSEGELTMLRFPLVAGLRWDVLTISIRLTQKVGFWNRHFSFESNWVVRERREHTNPLQHPPVALRNALKSNTRRRGIKLNLHGTVLLNPTPRLNAESARGCQSLCRA